MGGCPLTQNQRCQEPVPPSDSGSMVVAGTSFSGAFRNGQFKVVPFS
jgi:hypothetical protein